METLVLTCPSGKTCAALLPILTSPPYSSRFCLRLAAHTPSSAAALCAAYPSAQVVTGDLSSLAYCAALVSGATAVFFIGPSLHSHEREMSFNMVDAAVQESQKPESKFKHFVYSSVIGPHMRKLTQHDLKSHVEERLMLSPLRWTVIQLTNFMEALPVALLARMESPAIERLWSPDTPNSMVSFRDVADAVVKILTEREAHYYATYPLCSTFPVSDRAVCSVIESRIGKSITITTPSFERAVEKVLGYLFAHTDAGKKPDVYAADWCNSGINAEGIWMPGWQDDPRPDLTRDGAERLVLFYSRHGLPGNPSVLTWLLGRKPRTVEQWIDEELGRIGLSK